MSTWLYQLNQQFWTPERYRLDIWEGLRWSWEVGGKGSTDEPSSGDIVVFFYAPSGGIDPGFYGWAVILEWLPDVREIVFRPVAPSDLLKMRPWWDASAKDLANRIRGTVKQRTLWLVDDALVSELRSGIAQWTAGESGGQA